MPRQRPFVTSTRMTRVERTQIEVLARVRGMTVSEMVHRLILPQLRKEVSLELGLGTGEEVDCQ